MQTRRPVVMATALPPQIPLAHGGITVPPRLTWAAATAVAWSLPLLLAKAAVACTLGMVCRNFLAHINAGFDVPVEAMVTLTVRQRQRAVNTASAAACLICFLFLV